MKLFCVLTLFAVSFVAAVNPQLKQVTTVYILSMGSGMDQLLANRLTTLGVFQVVADPQKADAIITDRLGEPFENKLNELYPPPPAPRPVTKDAKGEKEKESGLDMGGGGAVRLTSFSRGRGTFFIVDRKSRNVLWSTYERPKDSSHGEMTKTAERVVKRLKSDLSDKKQGTD
jgi:hypothetical protein